MTQQIFDQWLNLLRNPDIHQCFYDLRRGDPENPETKCLCPLGVLCDILDPDAWYIASGYKWRWRSCSDQLPREIQHLIVSWNDDLKMSLPEVADRLQAMSHEIVRPSSDIRIEEKTDAR